MDHQSDVPDEKVIEACRLWSTQEQTRQGFDRGSCSHRAAKNADVEATFPGDRESVMAESLNRWPLSGDRSRLAKRRYTLMTSRRGFF